MLKKLLFRLSLCLALAAPAAWAAAPPPVTLRISQARLTPPEMVAYIDVRDAQGRASADLGPYQLRAQIDGAPVEVRGVKPFSEDEEGTAYIFLVDISRSIKSETFDQIRAALRHWVDNMTERDWAALLSFGDTVRPLVDFTQDKPLLTGTLAGLGPTDDNTRLHDALIRALELGRRMDANKPLRTAMVVLSDGMDDVPGSITGEETLARLQEEHLPLYAIGWASQPMTPAKREGLKHLGILARSSGGAYLAGEGRAPAQLFQDLRRMIREVQVVRLDASAYPADNRKRNLSILLKDDTRVLPDHIQVRMTAPLEPPPQDHAEAPPPPTPNDEDPPPPPDDAEAQKRKKLLLFGSIGLLLLLALGLLIYLLTRGSKKPIKPPPEPGNGNGPIWLNLPPEQPRDEPGTGQTIGGGDTGFTFGPGEDFLPPQPGGDTDPLPPLEETAPLEAATASDLFQLEIFTVAGRERNRVWRFDSFGRELVIGRASGCDVTIDDPEATARHCRLFAGKGRIWLEDLGSTNGTLLNGVPFQGVRVVESGDILTTGRTQLRINHRRK